jgi:outer membrane protein
MAADLPYQALQSMKRLILFLCLPGVAAAADWNFTERLSQTPEMKTHDDAGKFSFLVRKYVPAYQRPTEYHNSSRLELLLRAGNIYLSLQDAIALALENNLDIEYHRYDRRQAETDQLRASAGQLLRFQSSTITAGFSSATSGALGAANSLGNIGGSSNTGQTGILSGFTIQAAGSQIPNLEPLFFASWQGTHNTNPLTSSLTTGTNYLVSSAKTLDYGIQKAFLSGTNVQVDWYQQSLYQNAPANDINPSLKGNVEVSIKQPLLQGFGWSTNKRTITQAKNNLSVADLNFKEQVMSTVKNVADLYWDLVSFDENLKVKKTALDLAQKLYEDNKKRVAAGAIAPIDIIQAEAGMQTAELDYRNAETQVLQQEAILKSALTRTGVDGANVLTSRIIPTDTIQLPDSEPVEPIQDKIAYALANRPELLQTKISLENARVNMKGVRNAMLPGLDVFVDLQNNGLSGQVNAVPIPPVLEGVIPPHNPATANQYFLGSYGTVYKQVFGRNFPNYSVGFNLTIPLRNSGARADMIKNELDYRQAQIQQKQQENTIKLSVVNTQIALEEARRAYDTAVKARKLQEQTFVGERRKYELGTSTFLNVVLLQRDVVTAQSAEVAALSSYIRARSNMDLVLGRILEVDNVDLQEAFEGAVKRPPSPLPAIDKQPLGVAAPGTLAAPVKVPAVSALSSGSQAH